MTEREAEYRERVMNLVTTHGGRITLDTLRKERLVPGPWILPVMRGLCRDHKLLLEGECTYVLPPKQPQTSLPLRVEPTTTNALDKPVRALLESMTSGEGEADQGRQCCRCRSVKQFAQFERPGMQRAARICNDCAGYKPEQDAPSNTDARRYELRYQGTFDATPCTGVALPFPFLVTAPAAPTVPQSEHADELRIQVSPKVRDYLERLVRTGLFGDSINDAAECLIWSGIEQRLPMLSKVTA